MHSVGRLVAFHSSHTFENGLVEYFDSNKLLVGIIFLVVFARRRKEICDTRGSLFEVMSFRWSEKETVGRSGETSSKGSASSLFAYSLAVGG